MAEVAPMRERLIEKTGLLIFEARRDLRMSQEEAYASLEQARVDAEEIVDAILAELRTYVPAKDTVFVRFTQNGDEPEDNYYADETDAEVFTAMIDAVREGRA